jgi:hypothetical protein
MKFRKFRRASPPCSDNAPPRPASPASSDISFTPSGHFLYILPPIPQQGHRVTPSPIPIAKLNPNNFAWVQSLKASYNRWRTRQLSKKDFESREEERRNRYAEMLESERKFQPPRYEVLFQGGTGDKVAVQQFEVRTERRTEGSIEGAR